MFLPMRKTRAVRWINRSVAKTSMACVGRCGKRPCDSGSKSKNPISWIFSLIWKVVWSLFKERQKHWVVFWFCPRMCPHSCWKWACSNVPRVSPWTLYQYVRLWNLEISLLMLLGKSNRSVYFSLSNISKSTWIHLNLNTSTRLPIGISGPETMGIYLQAWTHI